MSAPPNAVPTPVRVLPTGQSAAPALDVPNPAAEEARRLAIRRREQLYYARHLHRQRHRQLEQEQHTIWLKQQADVKLQEFRRDYDRWLAEKSQLEGALAAEVDRIARQEVEVKQARETLELQRAEIAKQPAPAQREDVDINAMRLETEHLRKLLILRNREIAKAAEEQMRDTAAWEKQRDDLHLEINTLKRQMQENACELEQARAELAAQRDALQAELEAQAGQLQAEWAAQVEQKRAAVAAEAASSNGEMMNEVRRLRDQVAVLTRQLEEKEAQIGSLRVETERSAEARAKALDFENYEAELNDFRQQLESDRRELDEQLELLAQRKADLNDASRNAEVEMSRERAMLSRERVQLDRMRDEIRMEMERIQREAGSRDALGAIHKLTDEMSSRRIARAGGSSDGTAARPKPTGGSADGTSKAGGSRSLRGRLGDV